MVNFAYQQDQTYVLSSVIDASLRLNGEFGGLSFWNFPLERTAKSQKPSNLP